MILRSFLVVAMVAVACFAFVDPACAGTIQTIGSGSAIISIDRSVTFDDLDFAGRETPLSDYHVRRALRPHQRQQLLWGRRAG